MTDEVLVEALRGIAGTLRKRWAKPIRNREATHPVDRYDHLLYMCERAEELAKEGRTNKAHRWLGFVQGALWVLGLLSIDESRKLNKPEGLCPIPINTPARTTRRTRSLRVAPLSISGPTCVPKRSDGGATFSDGARRRPFLPASPDGWSSSPTPPEGPWKPAAPTCLGKLADAFLPFEMKPEASRQRRRHLRVQHNRDELKRLREGRQATATLYLIEKDGLKKVTIEPLEAAAKRYGAEGPWALDILFYWGTEVVVYSSRHSKLVRDRLYGGRDKGRCQLGSRHYVSWKYCFGAVLNVESI